MDIRQLRYFVAIVEQGSFSGAANFLHVAQPALSLHVRNMEADLGSPLLIRTPRGVEPTEAGAILLRHARIIMDQFTVAEEEIRGHHDDPAGEVRLGVPGTIGQILAVPLITAVRLRYPKIKLRMAEAMINTVFMAFLLANLLMVPFGLAAISAFQRVIRIPRYMLMPSVLAFCIIGSFAVENTNIAVVTMLVLGLIAFAMEKYGYPLAPTILGLVLGPMLEETFLNSLIRARGNPLAFVERPLSMWLAILTLAICITPLALFVWRKARNRRTA